MLLTVANPSEHPDFLDLPWAEELERWPDSIVSGRPGGLHRHPVRYVNRGRATYSIKELPDDLAAREFRLLRELAGMGLPCVEAVGLVHDRGPDAPQDVLITRYLDFSLPYRVLLTERRMPYLADRVLDALAGLLVRLHLMGFFWGDCSLSNTLFRRDAGALVAYVVDVETGELHSQLSDGQRRLDLDLATENIAGGLFDLQSAGRLDRDLDVVTLLDRLTNGYSQLWHELTATAELDPGDPGGVAARIARLNDLGFDVDEVEIVASATGRRVRLTPRVVELDFHAKRLFALTGLHSEENQARRLLNDIKEFGANLARKPGRALPESVIAARWLDQVFDPAVEAVGPELADKLEAAELYHQLLEHRWFLSERAGRDVGMADTTRSYVERVLRDAPDERQVLEPEELTLPDEGSETGSLL